MPGACRQIAHASPFHVQSPQSHSKNDLCVDSDWRGPRQRCQTALDWDPLSASKKDPFDRRARAVAIAPSELVGVAETARARLVCSSARLLKRQLSLPVSIMSQ